MSSRMKKMLCPNCGEDDTFFIWGYSEEMNGRTRRFRDKVSEDDRTYDDFEWFEDSPCQCPECLLVGEVWWFEPPPTEEKD